MSDLSIEYILSTPTITNSNENILSKKILDLMENSNMSGGGIGLKDMSNCISLLIGIIIIIIGFILLWFKNNLVETEAIIKTKSCDEDTGCKINIIYTVNSIQYSKIINVCKSNVPDTPTIKIYYQSLNPNLIELYDPNFFIIGIGMLVIGLLVIIVTIEGH